MWATHSDEELTRGPVEMMPRGQMSGSTCGWTHGIKPPPQRSKQPLFALFYPLQSPIIGPFAN